MKRNVCPYCDQVMDGMYCKGCRRIVRKPVVWEVDYYLNERHPDTEASCQYHGDLHTGEMAKTAGQAPRTGAGAAGPLSKAGSRTSGQAPRTGTRTAAHVPWTGTAGGNRKSEQGSSPAWEKKASRKTRSSRKVTGILAILIMYFVVAAVGVGMRAVKSAQRQVMEFVAPETVMSPESFDPEPPVEISYGNEPGVIYDYSDEEIIAAGIPCNGSGHLDITSGEFFAAFEPRIGEAFDFSVSSYSINQSLDEYTWYDTGYVYTLYSEGEECGQISFSFDTADASFHSLFVFADTAENLGLMSDALISSFSELGMPGAYDGASLAEKAAGLLEGEEMELALFDGLVTCCSRIAGGGYMLDIYVIYS